MYGIDVTVRYALQIMIETPKLFVLYGVTLLAFVSAAFVWSEYLLTCMRKIFVTDKDILSCEGWGTLIQVLIFMIFISMLCGILFFYTKNV
ncbi:hypothetical protein ACQVTS_32970 [Bacillus mycoides]|uniref:hypothetical protein n=1 Tax=Bacillus mycoides TaxID=1405 RepID=UPI003D64E1FC